MFDFSQIQIPANLLAGLIRQQGWHLIHVHQEVQAAQEAQLHPQQGQGWERRIRPPSGCDSISPFYTLCCNLTFREMLRANPDQMAMLKQNNSKLSEALESGDLEAFAKVLKEQQDARKEREQMRIRLELLSHTHLHWNQDLRLQKMINW